MVTRPAFPPLIPVPQCIGSHNIVFMVLDSLRFDVAQNAMAQGLTPFLQTLIPLGQWQKRQTHGTFTYPAHQAFFMGYLPVPIPKPANYQRLFACQFHGSETSGTNTWITPASNIVHGLQAVGYHTICIGGVGFFDGSSAIRQVLPNFFMESHWSPEMGVTGKDSTRLQVALAIQRLQTIPEQQKVFLYLNVSALHQPNCLFTAGATHDTPQTQANALAYVDQQLPPLFAQLQRRGAGLCIVCSDHGTAYGEDGYYGHGIAHPVIWEVPYAEWNY